MLKGNHSLVTRSSLCFTNRYCKSLHGYLNIRDRGRVGVQSFRPTPYSRDVHSRSTSKLEGGGGRSRNIYLVNK
ncbi:hypothetical protein IFM89_003522 [Coptis chinensis]|uniref:Uncharacterized protein n=1 Tax=Coptis chinensis TaxID=261450 RepID=A0A835GUD3_9MAGN|nr:hypothetical protein IFM89_003522 [Coptis chinensis]